jgi:hypothetical protein
MMHTTQGWSGLRTAVIALALLAWTATVVEAAPTNLLNYSTAGAIDTSSGVSGANVISYVPITNAQIDASSNLPLGSFQVAALPSGQTTTYTNTPFSITFIPSAYSGTALSNAGTVTVSGTLNGQITGPYQSSVGVAFSPVANGSFQLAGASSTLSMLQNDQKLLVPSSANNGVTTLEGTIKTVGGNPEAPVPEPSTIALFLSTVGGLGLRRYVLARRQRSQS